MAGTTCEHVDGASRCTNEAIQKCTGSWCHGGIYCVRHIQFLNSQYICDTCVRETERVRKEAEKWLAEQLLKKLAEEAKQAERDRERRLARNQADIADSIREARSLHYPRIMFVPSAVLLAVQYILYPHGYGPLLWLLLGYGGLALLVIAWIWTLVTAIRRGQWGWVIGLIFTPFLLLIPLPLYLLFNPHD